MCRDKALIELVTPLRTPVIMSLRGIFLVYIDKAIVIEKNSQCCIMYIILYTASLILFNTI